MNFPGPSGICEWLVHPDTATELLELGAITVNGLHADIETSSEFAIRDNVIKLVFRDGVTAAQEFDPWTTDQLQFATKGKWNQ